MVYLLTNILCNTQCIYYYMVRYWSFWFHSKWTNHDIDKFTWSIIYLRNTVLNLCLYIFNDIVYYYLLPTLICIPTRYIVIDMIICVFCSRSIWTYAPCVYKFNIIIHNVIYCTHVYNCRTRVIGSVSNTSCGHLSFPHPRARRTVAADKTHVVRRRRVTDS